MYSNPSVAPYCLFDAGPWAMRAGATCVASVRHLLRRSFVFLIRHKINRASKMDTFVPFLPVSVNTFLKRLALLRPPTLVCESCVAPFPTVFSPAVAVHEVSVLHTVN